MHFDIFYIYKSICEQKLLFSFWKNRLECAQVRERHYSQKWIFTNVTVLFLS